MAGIWGERTWFSQPGLKPEERLIALAAESKVFILVSTCLQIKRDSNRFP